LKLDISYRGVVSLFHVVNEDIVNFLIVLIAILVTPLYIYWLYNGGVNQSWLIVLSNVVLYSLYCVAFLIHKVSFRIKKAVLLVILLYGYACSTYLLGIFGGAQYFVILIFGLVLFCFPRWLAISVTTMIILYYVVFMFLYTNGRINYYIEPSVLVTSQVIWIFDFLLTVVLTATFGYALYKIFMAYSKKANEQIESQKMLHYTLENLPIPVGILNSHKKVIYVNKCFTDYFGYQKQEIPTFNDWLHKVYPNLKQYERKKEEVDKLLSDAFVKQHVKPIEYDDFSAKNKAKKSVEVHHTIIGDTAICAFVDLTERRRQRRVIVETMMHAEKKENGRIAQELHDGIGPLLSTAKIYVHNISQGCNCNQQEEYLERLNTLLDNSIAEVRNIINNIGPQILLQYGLTRAVQSFIKHIQAVSSVEFRFQAQDVSLASKLTEFAVYRSLIELINNSIKYASSTVISINMVYSDQLFMLKYSDNGVGFDYDMARFNGYGLDNMKNRIENVGGILTYQTALGQGVCVDVTIKDEQNEKDSYCYC